LHPAFTLTNAAGEGSQNFVRRSEMANTCPKGQVSVNEEQVEILTCFGALAIVPERCVSSQYGQILSTSWDCWRKMSAMDAPHVAFAPNAFFASRFNDS
jgi:hypothetical protein